jgi:hypothetical protein
MNGKFEEKLAQLAFGDLTPSEANRLELEADKDPEARRALMLYKDMREGLRSLADVPEDQFSKERLRDAILKQGLKPTPSRPLSNRSWLWMPVAACAIGFGLVFTRHMIEQGRMQTEVVLGPESLKTGPMFGVEKLIAFASKSVNLHQEFIGPMLTAARKPIVLASRHRTRHHLEPHELPHNLYVENATGEEGDMLFLGPDLTDVPADTTPARQAVVATTASTGPILLIDQDKDAQTGAQKATEVGSATNVLIGG